MVYRAGAGPNRAMAPPGFLSATDDIIPSALGAIDYLENSKTQNCFRDERSSLQCSTLQLAEFDAAVLAPRRSVYIDSVDNRLKFFWVSVSSERCNCAKRNRAGQRYFGQWCEEWIPATALARSTPSTRTCSIWGNDYKKDGGTQICFRSHAERHQEEK